MQIETFLLFCVQTQSFWTHQQERRTIHTSDWKLQLLDNEGPPSSPTLRLQSASAAVICTLDPIHKFAYVFVVQLLKKYAACTRKVHFKRRRKLKNTLFWACSSPVLPDVKSGWDTPLARLLKRFLLAQLRRTHWTDRLILVSTSEYCQCYSWMPWPPVHWSHLYTRAWYLNAFRTLWKKPPTNETLLQNQGICTRKNWQPMAAGPTIIIIQWENDCKNIFKVAKCEKLQQHVKKRRNWYIITSSDCDLWQINSRLLTHPGSLGQSQHRYSSNRA